MAKSSNTTIMDTLGMWFAKAPALPKNWRDVLAKIAPVLALIFGILGLLGSLTGLGILGALSPFAMMAGVHAYGNTFIAAIIWLVSYVFMLAAYPGLQGRKVKGWNMLFWSEMLGLLGSIVALSIISGIISALIGFYLLYQIRSYYK